MKKLILFHSFLIISAFSNSSNAQQMTAIVDYLAPKAITLNTPVDLDLLIKKAGKRKLVLLGEASHGTLEYYEWRAILKRIVFDL